MRALVIGAAAAVLSLTAPGLPAGASPGAVDSAGVAATRFQQWGAAEEQAFVDKINQLRASLGLGTLTVDLELTAQARIWAQTMKDAGNIFHSQQLDAGMTADWAKLGENVGVGGTVDALFDAFVASPKHYENLVDPLYTRIGIGVVWDGSRMFTAHRFMALMPEEPTTTAPAPKAPRTTPKTATPDPTAAAPDELASAEPPTTTPPPPPPPVVPPAQPTRVALILATIDDVLD